MAPSGDAFAGSITAEKAFSFISKSWRDVRKSADEDMKRMRARAKSFTDLATTFDKEIENLRKSSLNLVAHKQPRSFFTNLEGGRQLHASLNVSSLEDNFLRMLQPKFSNADISMDEGDPRLASQGKVSTRLNLSSLKLPIMSYVEDEDFYSGHDSEHLKFGSGIARTLQMMDLKKKSGARRGSRRAKLLTKEWQPLRRFKDSWKDLETVATNSGSPSEFLENLKKTKLFEKIKKNLRLTSPDSEEDVAPLDVPELVVNLVKQSEPWLDQIGIKKDVAETLCDMLQKYKWKDRLSSCLPQSRKHPADVEKTFEKCKDEFDLRLARVLQSTGYNYRGRISNEQMPRDKEDGHCNVAIFTTACLPWMTGTAINPMYRAAFLAKNGKRNVTLLVPWLCKKDQLLVYPNQMTFDSPEEQEIYIRHWLESRIGFKPGFKLTFYPGKFSKQKRSILASGDISHLISDKEAHIAVLEEPEHLTWYYHGKRWSDKFQHVVGVVHTNYLEYVKREKNGALQAFLLEHINNWLTRAHCHKVVRLSAATQELPKSTICNVHGVSPKFLEIGQKMLGEQENGRCAFSKGAYFLGKMLWGKGYRELVDLLAENKDELGALNLDVFGTGEDALEVQAAARKVGLDMNFYQGRDHADEMLHGYKVFINPSISDVVCTTTAEALAMGKIVVCADHPSNEFFKTFPNCLTYKNSHEFVEKVKQAMASEPVPLCPEERHLLSWDAATKRFIEYAELDQPSCKTRNKQGSATETKTMPKSFSLPNLSKLVDDTLAAVHYCYSGNEAARLIAGALPWTMNYNSEQSRDLCLPLPAVQSPIYGW